MTTLTQAPPLPLRSLTPQAFTELGAGYLPGVLGPEICVLFAGDCSTCRASAS